MNISLSAGELSPNEPLKSVVGHAATTQAGGIELWYPANVGESNAVETADVLKEAGLVVTCIATATQLGSPDRWAADRETLLAAVTLARQLGVGLVNTYFGLPESSNDLLNIRAYACRIDPVLQLAHDSGITVVLENEFDCFGFDTDHADVTRRPWTLAKLVEIIDSTAFGLTFDACNAYFAGLDPFHDFLSPLVDQVRYVHVKDGYKLRNDSLGPSGWRHVSDSGHRYTTCSLGDGEIDWAAISAHLTQHSFDGWWTLEPHCHPHIRADAWRTAASHLRSLAKPGLSSSNTDDLTS